MNTALTRYAFDAAIREAEREAGNIKVSKQGRNDAVTLLARLKRERALIAVEPLGDAEFAGLRAA